MATSIWFIPDHNNPCEESGEFYLDAAACLDYLRKQVGLYAIPLDVLLLKWTDEAQGESVIPDKFGERGRYMVAELVDNKSVVQVLCRRCGKSLLPDSLIRRQWDDSNVEHGIRVGTSGYEIDCPSGHCLILICDRIY